MQENEELNRPALVPRFAKPRHARFVILSFGRSGTTMLVSALNQHGDIYCHGEIFHPRKPMNVRPQLEKHFPDLLKDRFERPVRTALKVLSFANGLKAAGFKMWRTQSPMACNKLLADDSVKKIIIDRENKLAQFSSRLVGLSTGVWDGRAAPDKIERPKVAFDSQAFLNFAKARETATAYYRDNAVGDVLNVSYSDLVRCDFAPILAFIGVEERDIKPNTPQMNSSDILSRFDPVHHDAIIACLEGIGKPEWVSEA